MEGLTFEEHEAWMVERGYDSRGPRVCSFRRFAGLTTAYIRRRTDNTWVVTVYRDEPSQRRVWARAYERAEGFPTPMAAHVYAEIEGWLA